MTIVEQSTPVRRTSGKAAARRRIMRNRAELAKRFPSCIAKSKGPKKPLARGADQQIAAKCPDIPFWIIKETLGDYTRGPTYLLAVLTCAHRIGLDGADVEPVDDHSRAHARAMLAKHWPHWLETISQEGAKA